MNRLCSGAVSLAKRHSDCGGLSKLHRRRRCHRPDSHDLQRHCGPELDLGHGQVLEALELNDDIKADVHTRSRPFAEGHHDGSFLDAETTNPNPLSAMKVNLGRSFAPGERPSPRPMQRPSPGTTGCGYVSAPSTCSPATTNVSSAKVPQPCPASAGTRSATLDAALLSIHRLPVVRQLAAIVAAAAPARYAKTCRTSRPIRMAPFGDRLPNGYTKRCARNLRPAVLGRTSSAALGPSSPESSTPFNTTCVTPCGERQPARWTLTAGQAGHM